MIDYADPWDRLLPYLEWRGDCLIFTGGLAGNGYGLFGIRLGRADWRKVLIHRWVWEQTVGPIPDDMTLDHVEERGCISKACVNIHHLEPVTRGDNVRRYWQARSKVSR